MAGINQQSISESETHRPTYIKVDLKKLEANFRAIQSAAPSSRVMPVLKANAYGHGLTECALHLESLGCDYFAVAVLEEALLLREAGVQAEILVLGGLINDQVPLYIKHDITITASSIDKLNHTDQTARDLGQRAKVHLKIDTGMERIGVHYYSAEALIEASQKITHTEVQGIYSHLSDADDLDRVQLQYERFEGVLKIYEMNEWEKPDIVHLANSGAILRSPETHYNLVRPGLILFGVYPDQSLCDHFKLQPVLSWHTQVAYFKVIQPDHPVSYGSTWKSDKETRIVTLPVGYGDGYFRAISNKGEVLIRGKRYPIVGTICMDQMMVNIGWDEVFNGDEVILIGQDGDQVINVNDLAKHAGTIPWEVLTNINWRVSRRYIKD